jgi:hypothetical protein
MSASRKKVFETVDGTPEKRLFLSIISDYDLRTGICELVDNALDLWTTNGRSNELAIDVTLDVERQIIQVVDYAGGVNEADLRLLIAPGASRNAPEDELIGIFGVGGKRAAVALGEHVEIRTRQGKGRSLQIEITNDWLSVDDWQIEAYEIAPIEPSSTIVDISKVRQSFSSDDVDEMMLHLGETYSWFLRNGCTIKLNGDAVVAREFKAWAYPPGFQPRQADFVIAPAHKGKLRVKMTAGLITDRIPEAENYGVYLYCNHRLIVKELRTRDVGYFVTGEAGVPHPDASLCRVVVELEGPAELMPWNSSKSGISFNHPAFATIRPKIIWLVSYFSSLSRRLKHDWDAQVFAYPKGNMEPINPAEMLSGKKIALPKLPSTRKPARIDVLRSKNKRVMSSQPWTVGLVEAMGAVELVTRQNLESKNRIALILLDSNFEIGLKEFIVHRADLFPPPVYNDAKIAALFKSRHQVINEVKQHVTLPAALLGKVSHYYTLRNKLIHERASVGISDRQVDDYRAVVEKVLKALFNLKFPAAA